jgi:hypothetical protein
LRRRRSAAHLRRTSLLGRVPEMGNQSLLACSCSRSRFCSSCSSSVIASSPRVTAGPDPMPCARGCTTPRKPRVGDLTRHACLSPAAHLQAVPAGHERGGRGPRRRRVLLPLRQGASHTTAARYHRHSLPEGGVHVARAESHGALMPSAAGYLALTCLSPSRSGAGASGEPLPRHNCRDWHLGVCGGGAFQVARAGRYRLRRAAGDHRGCAQHPVDRWLRTMLARVCA